MLPARSLRGFGVRGGHLPPSGTVQPAPPDQYAPWLGGHDRGPRADHGPLSGLYIFKKCINLSQNWIVPLHLTQYNKR